MASAGTLTVNVTAGTANFQRDIQEAIRQIKEFGGVHGSTMRESVGGVRLLSHELGVPLPREIARLIATIPGVGAAMTALLPIMGAVFAVTMISSFIKKHEELISKQREQAAVTAGVTEKFDAEALSIDLTNLKLEDQIAKLEKKPKNNGVKEAILENQIAMDKFVEKASTDLAKLTKDTESYSQVWGIVKEAASNAFSMISSGSPKIMEFLKGMAPEVELLIEAYKKFGPAAMQALAPLAVDTEKVQLAQEGVTAATIKFGQTKTGTQEHADALKELNKAYDNVAKAATFASMTARREGNEVAAAQFENTARQADADEAQQAGIEKTAALRVELAKKTAAADRATAEATLARDNKSIVGEMKTSWEDFFESYGGGRKEAKKYSEEAAKADEKELSHIREVDEENKKEASSLQAVAKSKHEVAMIHIDDDVKSGNTSKIDEQAEKKKILEVEHQDLVDAHASDIAEEQRYVAALNAAAQLMPEGEARTKALHDAAEAQSRLNEMTAKYNIELAKNESAQKSCDIEQKRLSGDFKQWIKDMQHDMPSTAAMLEKDFSKAFDGMNSAMAKTLVEGKNFGKAMKQVGAELLESVIEQELKKLEVYILSLIKKKAATVTGDAAQIAAATATAAAIKPILASMSAAAAFESVMEAEPYPANVIAAPLQATIAFGEAMAFAKGGLVPGYGNYDSVPAMLTPGESVVSKALTQQVENSQGGSSNQGHTVHIHMGDVHAVDAKGFEGLLEKHAAVVGKHVQSQMRRMHRKVN